MNVSGFQFLCLQDINLRLINIKRCWILFDVQGLAAVLSY